MQPDLLQRVAAPLRVPLEQHLGTLLPPWTAGALGSLLDLGGLAGLAFLLAVTCRLLTRLADDPARQSRLAAVGIRPAAGGAALVLLAWILRHPSPGFEALFLRWDHLVFCALAGLAAAAVPGLWRKVGLASLSAALLVQYNGGRAVLLVVATGLVGFALMRTPLGRRRWTLVLSQGALLAAAYGYAFWVRSWSVTLAAPVQGLLTFALLRHLSFVVEAAKAPKPLADYAAFMVFYPGISGVFGAPEVYAEFSRRNLVRPLHVDHARAARFVAVGALQAWIALRIPASVDAVLASPGPALAWANAVLLYVRTALALMGGWAIIEAVALFFGVQLRVNFRGLLTCENPSELWWAWRGTLTNWLVQHIYGPLGGRRRVVRNILAAFGVSLLWHALGVPFLGPQFRFVQVVPVILWATISATAVVVHAVLPRRGVPPGPAGRALRTVLMWVLGAMNPLLLSFQGEAVVRFPALLRVLFGVAG